MKTTRFSIFLTLLLISALCLPSTFAQDAAQWSLPDGASLMVQARASVKVQLVLCNSRQTAHVWQ